MPRIKRVIISQDYDGCYCIVAPGGVDAELQGANKLFFSQPKNKPLADLLLKIPTLYEAYLSQITANAHAVSVYDGSDRQSHRLDKLNVEHNRNGSVFPALQGLCEKNTTSERPWTFEPLLMADAGYPRGEALRRMKTGGVDLEIPRYTQFVSGTKRPSKIPMLVAQMKDAYHQYPDDDIEFHFIDDRSDLIEDIEKNLKLEDIPPNTTLVLSKFDYIGVLMKADNSFGRVATLQSPLSEEKNTELAA